MRRLNSFEVVGLQFMVTPVLSWTGGHKKLDKHCTKSLLKLLDEAILGLEWSPCIHNLHLRDKFEKTHLDWRMDDYIKIERAYNILKPILPTAKRKAEKYLKRVRKLCLLALDNKATAEDKKELREFCMKFCSYLDKLWAETEMSHGQWAGRIVM